MYAEVCLPFSLNKTFTYKVPSAIKSSVRPGTLVKVLFKNKKCDGFIVSISDNTKFTGKINSIISINSHVSIPSELWDTIVWSANYYITPIGKVTQIALSWIFKKNIHKKNKIKFITLNTKKYSLDYFSKNLDTFTLNQQNLIKHLITKYPQPLSLIDLKKNIPSIYNIYLPLIKNNFLVEQLVTLDSENLNTKLKSIKDIELSKMQNNIYSEIHSKSILKPHFIHGITGSGKTEIYLKLTYDFYKKGKSCLILVPEIVLSSQIFRRFQQYFGKNVLLWHSQASDAYKRDAWNKINTDKPYIVIGARSAIFVPLNNLELIIVDEEHDSSYKESERQPCYNARDLAIVRSKFSKALIILGSATPSVETYYNSIINKYYLYELMERYGQSTLPKVELVNFNDKNHKVFNKPVLTPKIINAINETINKGEQVLILHNRRGYSAIQVCNETNETLKCDSCDVTLTFHAANNELICHHCNNRFLLDSNHNIQYLGYGTEQLEFLLNETFPNYSILRMDADSANSMNKQNKILNQFKSGNYHILLGTQMIAKGLDIQNITLVLVLNADVGMMIPDFKSYEKTFQLIYQVIGRSGRSHKKGKAIIQTFQPENIILQMATNYESKRFYNLQLESRKSLNYPPFSRLLRIICKSKSHKTCESQSIKFFNLLKKECNDFMIGPLPCPIEKISNYFRYHIIIKIPHKKLRLILSKIHDIMNNQNILISKNSKILIDMDSNSVL